MNEPDTTWPDEANEFSGKAGSRLSLCRSGVGIGRDARLGGGDNDVISVKLGDDSGAGGSSDKGAGPDEIGAGALMIASFGESSSPDDSRKSGSF